MADLGLLSGVAEGLKQGLGSYMQVKQANDQSRQAAEEAALKKRMFDQQMSQQADELEYRKGKDAESMKFNIEKERQHGLIPQYGEEDKFTGFLYDEKQKPQKEVDPLVKQLREANLKKLARETQFYDSNKESELRKEYGQLGPVKRAQDVNEAFKKIQIAGKNPSAAGDLSLIFGYMKMLDPGSTVREGEFANAQNAAGVPDQLVNMYNRLKTGERLNPTQRQDFLSQAGNVYNAQIEALGEENARYSEIAKKQGLRPENIVRSYPKFDANAEKQAGLISEGPKPLPVVQYGQHTMRLGADGKYYKVVPQENIGTQLNNGKR